MASPTGVWRQLTRGLRALFDRSAADRDLTAEVQHYLDQTAAAYRKQGLSEAEALRAARLEVGTPTAVREAVRSYGWENAIDGLLTDLRYAVRRLRAAPGFTAVAVITLGTGVGATTAIFSAIKPILLEPLPYPGAGRLAALREGGRTGPAIDGTFGSFRTLVERARSFEQLAVLRPWQPTLTGADRPERLEGQRVSAGYFDVFGIGPALGTGFRGGDDHPGGPRVTILSDALWRRRFGADRGVIGRTVSLDDDAFTVVGVMPAGFENVLAPSAQVWTLLQYDLADGRAWGHHLGIVARLAPGVGLEQARLELQRIAPDIVPLAAAANGFFPGGFVITSLRDTVTGGVREALLAVIGAVILVLAIACVNVTNLLLSRGASRRGELAVRATLGAGRSRLVRQLLTESLLLASMGGAVGLGIAVVGVRILVAVSPEDLPRLGAIAVDGPVFAFGLVLTTLVGLAFGLVPALQGAGEEPTEGLQWSSRRTVGRKPWTRRALVVAEVALALILLVGSGLLFRSLATLLAVRSGFEPEGIITLKVQATGHRLAEAGATGRFFEDVLTAVKQVPGVAAAGLTNQLPLSGDRDEFGAHFEAGPDRETGSYSVFRYAVSPDYLEAMGVPLRRGRLLDDGDRAGAPRVALLSESLARRRFPTGDPLGQRIRVGPADGPPYTIVGIVGDVRQASLGLSDTDAIYTTEAQWWFEDNAMTLVVKTGRKPADLAPALRAAIWSVDPNQPIFRVGALSDLVAASASERRFALILFEAFALAALVLAAAGIYGVMSASVAERTREIGVRAALGASRGAMIAMVVGEGLALTGLGVGFGLAGAFFATRALVALLFGVSRLDPTTYLAVTAVLAAVALAACGVPAWRAARVDPATTLRMD